jgi:dTDP-4-dehydrorhamnose 3,5-epimerase
MQISPTGLPGVLLLQAEPKPDERGLFCEVWTADDLSKAGLPGSFAQMNYSRSRRGALRGLHYQAAPHGQGKLITVMTGRIYDVVVDLRQSSPTFGQWQGRYLDDKNHEQLYVPVGLAHGFLALTENTVVSYACTNPYNPQADRSLRWNDPDLAIDWPIAIGIEPIVSPKDAAAATFADCETYD